MHGLIAFITNPEPREQQNQLFGCVGPDLIRTLINLLDNAFIERESHHSIA